MSHREIVLFDSVVAIGWPITPSGADGVVVFVEGGWGQVNNALLQKKQRKVLPQTLLIAFLQEPGISLTTAGPT